MHRNSNREAFVVALELDFQLIVFFEQLVHDLTAPLADGEPVDFRDSITRADRKMCLSLFREDAPNNPDLPSASETHPGRPQRLHEDRIGVVALETDDAVCLVVDEPEFAEDGGANDDVVVPGTPYHWIPDTVIAYLTARTRLLTMIPVGGGVAEWPNAPVLKTGVG